MAEPRSEDDGLVEGLRLEVDIGLDDGKLLTRTDILINEPGTLVIDHVARRLRYWVMDQPGPCIILGCDRKTVTAEPFDVYCEEHRLKKGVKSGG